MSPDALVVAGLPADDARNFEARLAALSGAAARAVDDGRLATGLRAVAPFWILFHWNRVGFDLEAQRNLAVLIAKAVAPRGWRIAPGESGR